MNTAERLDTLQTEHTKGKVFKNIDFIFSRHDLSMTEKGVMVKMLTACGDRGWVYYGVKSFAEKMAMSPSRTRSVLSKLVSLGFLQRTPRTSRVNVWHIPRYWPGEQTTDHEPQALTEPQQIPPQIKQAEPTKSDSVNLPDSGGGDTESSSPLLNTICTEITFKNVSGTRVTKQPKPNNRPFDISLVHEIEGIMKTSRDRGCWIKIVRECSSDIVRGAISSLKDAMREKIIERPGAYLVQAVKAHYPNLFCKTSITPKPENMAPINTPPRVIKPVTHAQTVTRNDAMNMAEIRKIREMLELKTPEGPDANRLNRSRNTRSF